MDLGELGQKLTKTEDKGRTSKKEGEWRVEGELVVGSHQGRKAASCCCTAGKGYRNKGIPLCCVNAGRV